MSDDRLMVMLTRRVVLRSLVGVGAASASYPLLAGCGDAPVPDPARVAAAKGSYVSAGAVPRSLGVATAQPDAVHAVQAMTADLYLSLAVEPGNLVCSPYSVAVALAMTRNGARGRTAREMDDVLSAPSLDRFNAGLNSLTRLIDGRAGRQRRGDGSRARVSLDVANSLWGQRDTRWQPAFLDVLARDYGTGMRLVDYRADSEAVRTLINAWTAAKTHDRIPQIIPPGVVDAMTRLVLVNAMYLKAPWEEPFAATLTRRRPFVRADGSQVETDMMSGLLESASFSSGPGWRAAQLPYAGSEIAMTIVVPDQPGLTLLERSLTGPVLAQMLTGMRPVPSLQLQLPRWSFRVATQLNEVLADLGMPTAFDPTSADFSGMTTDEQLYISAVLHQAFVAVDEHGTEAAAATAVVMSESGGTTASPVVLNTDRAFLFVIHDIETATPLFIGRVDDPTSSA